MDKTKVIWLDIGTLAQEHRSLFGAPSWFWWKIMRRFVAGNLLSRGKAIQISYILHIFNLRNKIKLAKDQFHFSFVEPNINLISNNAFLKIESSFVWLWVLIKSGCSPLESYFIHQVIICLREVRSILKAKDIKILNPLFVAQSWTQKNLWLGTRLTWISVTATTLSF